jgi:hypothetical protein
VTQGIGVNAEPIEAGFEEIFIHLMTGRDEYYQ